MLVVNSNIYLPTKIKWQLIWLINKYYFKFLNKYLYEFILILIDFGKHLDLNK